MPDHHWKCGGRRVASVGLKTLFVGLLRLMCFVHGSQAQIVLNEIMPAPTGGQIEFIEIWNRGQSHVALNALEIADLRKSWSLVAEEGEILPGQMLVLVPDLEEACATTIPCAQAIEVRPWPSLNNGGDSVFVRVGGTMVERTGYSGDDAVSGRSLERISPEAPAWLASNWKVGPIGGSPGALNASYLLDITPPSVSGAEWDGVSKVTVWFSEDLDPVRPGKILADGIDVETGSVISSRIEFAWPSHPDEISVEGTSDYSGNTASFQSLDVTRPAEPSDVFLSEILFEDEEANNLPEFVELTNLAVDQVSIRGGRLHVGTQRYDLAPEDSTRIMLPGESLVYHALHEPGALDLVPPKNLVAAPGLSLRNTGDLVSITSRSGVVWDAVDYHPGMKDIRFDDHKGRSIRRVSVDSGVYAWASTLGAKGATPGSFTQPMTSAQIPEPEDLIFTEIMYDPLQDSEDGQPDQPEYLEWINVSNKDVSTMGLYVSFPPDDFGKRDSIRVGYQPEILSPGQVMVAHTIDDGISDSNIENTLTEPFPESNGTEFVRLPLRANLHLTNSGRRIQLFSAGTELLAESDYHDDLHHPALQETKGRSLERSFSHQDISAPGPWSTSSNAFGGTPGQICSATLCAQPKVQTETDADLSVSIDPKSIYPEEPHLHRTTNVHVIRRSGGESPALIEASVYSIAGDPIRKLTGGSLLGSHYATSWHGTDEAGRLVPTGVYVILITISQGASRSVKKFKRPVSVIRR